MRKLVILRGTQCSGKTSFVCDWKLEDYTICLDRIREMALGVHLDADGEEKICFEPSAEKQIVKIADMMLEQRFKDGSFTILDSCNVKQKYVDKYIQMAKQYYYKVYIVDMMTGLTLDECLGRNRNRSYNKIPEEAIRDFYEEYQKGLKVDSDVKVLKPVEFHDAVFEHRADVLTEDVVVIGDIHGCYKTLMKALNRAPKNSTFVFLGDYCDRGPHNAEVLNWVLEHRNDSDKIFLEGNHERHLKDYIRNRDSASKEFNTVTRPQLDAAGIDKKELRLFLRESLKEAYWFDVNGWEFFTCHGGVVKEIDARNMCKNTVSYNPVVIRSKDLIHGTGGYTDYESMARQWHKYNRGSIIQIHGHRNKNYSHYYDSSSCLNLEGNVENGGSLRMVIIHGGWKPTIETVDIPNCEDEEEAADLTEEQQAVKDFVEKCRSSEFIREKKFGDISSFNFTRKAFQDGIWDDITMKARGMYINTKTNKIVCRGYDKFFNMGELPGTSEEDLKTKLKFPVNVYQKENGFLCLIGYDDEQGLIITTKSDLEGQYAQYAREVLVEKIGNDGLDRIERFLAENLVTLAVEVIDPVNDPHIIKYSKPEVYLLAIIQNTLMFEQKEYWDVSRLAGACGFNCKEEHGTLHDVSEYEEFINDLAGEHNNRTGIEGYVLEDANGYMVKAKTYFYKYWKHKRAVLFNKVPKFTDPDDEEMYNWYRKHCPEVDNIIDFRDKWFEYAALPGWALAFMDWAKRDLFFKDFDWDSEDSYKEACIVFSRMNFD